MNPTTLVSLKDYGSSTTCWIDDDGSQRLIARRPGVEPEADLEHPRHVTTEHVHIHGNAP